MVDRLIQGILVSFGKTLGNGVSRTLEIRGIIGSWSNSTGYSLSSGDVLR